MRMTSVTQLTVCRPHSRKSYGVKIVNTGLILMMEGRNTVCVLTFMGNGFVRMQKGKIMFKVSNGQDPYSAIGKYIRDHITAIEDMIAVIKINEVETNQLFTVDINEENYFIWENDWWEGEEDVTLMDFFPVSEAQRANQNVQSADTINRQDAIDEIRKCRFVVDAIEKIRALPSAQSEQSKQRWIPCSERLPKEADYKGCSECIDGAVWYYTDKGAMGLGYYYESTKAWSTTYDECPYGEVIAWMPLPEPYKERREE